MRSEAGPGRRLHTGLAVLLGLAALVLGRAGLAQDAEAPPAASEQRTEARQHFDNGVKLYGDGNYGGALAEFQAAYQLSPSAGAMQNVALCQKALFRYAEAATTLEELLTRYGQSVDAETARAVRDAIDELKALVGSIVIKVTPPDARVTVDGKTVEAGDLTVGIRLNVGEHTLGATAPGYAAMTRVIQVAGGQKQVPHQLALRPTMGFLEVKTEDAKDAIAIDGRPTAYQHWKGPLAAGVHLVQVYRSGFTAFERQVDIEVGKTVALGARVGPPLEGASDEPAAVAPGTTPPAKPRQQRGWYALGTAGLLGLPDEPQGLKHDSGIGGKTKAGGGALGLRAGYRLWTPVWAELMLEWGKEGVKGVCDKTASDRPCSLHYTLATVRVGPNVRLTTSGEKLRFSTAFGAGSVRHTFDLAASDWRPGVTAAGWNPYFMLELGLGLNLGHVLLGFDATAFVDGTTKTKSDDASHYKPYDGLLILGLGLRGGWSEWAPSKGSKLLQPVAPAAP
jgi:hypothetical protein